MITKRLRILFLFFIMCFLLIGFNYSRVVFAENVKKKLYISTIQTVGVSLKTASIIRERLMLSIFEQESSNYYVVSDEDIKAMYKQAETIMSSGCNAEACIIQIADAIDADEILFGEVRLEDPKLRLILHNMSRDRKTLKIFKKSLVNIAFDENEIDYYITEAAKKLLNPSYRMAVKDPTSTEGIKLQDVKVLEFKTSDTTINEILPYLKEIFQDGDKKYDNKDYEAALDVYQSIIEKVNSKLTHDKQILLKPLVEAVQERIDTCLVMISFKYVEEGDEFYKEYNFNQAMQSYNSGFNESQKILNNKKKYDIGKDLTAKIATVKKTGENYLFSKVKSLLDQAQSANIQDLTSNALQLIEQAHSTILDSDFFTKEVFDEYNKVIMVIDKESPDLLKAGENNIYINTRGEIFRDKNILITKTLSDEIIVITYNEKFGLINNNGRIIQEIKYEEISEYVNGLAKFKFNKNWGFINEKGVVTIPVLYSDAEDFNEKYAKVTNGELWFCIDKSGNRYFDPDIDLHPIKDIKTGKFGYSDYPAPIRERLFIKPKYDNADVFSENLAPVMINGKWGFINKLGNFVVQCSYDDVRSFAEGFAAVKSNGLWGYVNKSGGIAFSCIFDEAEDFKNGKAVIKHQEKEGTAYKNGDIEY